MLAPREITVTYSLGNSNDGNLKVQAFRRFLRGKQHLGLDVCMCRIPSLSILVLNFQNAYSCRNTTVAFVVPWKVFRQEILERDLVLVEGCY